MNTPVCSEDLFLAEGAIVKGDCIIGERCSVWYHAVIRADRGPIRIGNGTNIQDQVVVHCSQGYSVKIGNGVTVGHGAIVHGCTIDDNTVIGMRAVVMNGAHVGKNCIIGAGSVITQNIIIPDNSLVVGCPAKVMRAVTAAEIDANRLNAETYCREAQEYKAQQ